MPTGYTAPVMDGEITTARDYLLTVARAFGAFIHQRDEGPSVAPRVPDKSTYHHEQLVKAEERQIEFEGLDEAGRRRQYDLEFAERLQSWRDSQQRSHTVAARYDDMIAQVIAWTPEPGHEGVKKLALEQLQESRKFDVYDTPQPEQKPYDEWVNEMRTRLKRDIDYHSEHATKADKQHATQVAWINTFFASLPAAEKEGAKA